MLTKLQSKIYVIYVEAECIKFHKRTDGQTKIHELVYH